LTTSRTPSASPKHLHFDFDEGEFVMPTNNKEAKIEDLRRQVRDLQVEIAHLEAGLNDNEVVLVDSDGEDE